MYRTLRGGDVSFETFQRVPMLRLVLKKELLLVCTLQKCGYLLIPCVVCCSYYVLSDCKYEKIIILSVVMMRNDIIISLD